MYHANNEKEKKIITEGRELSNQESNKTLGKKENYKYLRKLEAKTIKQSEIKDKVLKNSTSKEQKKTSRNQAL